MIRKRPSPSAAKRASEDLDREFLQIKKALVDNASHLEGVIQARFQSPKPWKFHSIDFVLQETGETIDLVFEHPVAEDPRYVLVHLSIPYLHKGQKFSLDARARQFQKQQEVAMSRVKKAILLVKRAGETINTSESRLHCPIIELERESLLPGTVGERTQAPVADPAQFSEALLGELKSAIARECLSTLAKRRNKYIRKGLWRWIEREIVDPNIHFFLVILSCIYQGNTSEVLSRRFKSLEDYTKTPAQVIDALFSNETELATEITRNAERHRKALTRFLECFSQTPPFEYLKSLFLKEFRTCREGGKARAQVFMTLKELLGRCGFQGEKEIQYPLEILDELNVFQGLMMGHYPELRIENATKKLRHLVPQIAWTTEDIYRLRDELARLFGLPPQEFNLNAFLPQAFVSALPVPAKPIAAPLPRKAAVPEARAPLVSDQVAEPVSENREEVTPGQEDYSASPSPSAPEEFPTQPTIQTPPERPAPSSGRRTRGSRKESVADLPVAPLGGQPGDLDGHLVSTAVPASTDLLPPQPTPESRISGLFGKAVVPGSGPAMAEPVPPAAPSQPARPPAAPNTGSQVQGPQVHGSQTARQAPPPPPQPRMDRPQNPQPLRRPGFEECDETRHRNFESFGGHLQTDEDSVRFALEMDRFVHDSALKAEARARVQSDGQDTGEFDDSQAADETAMLKVSRPNTPLRPSDPLDRPMREQGDRPRRRRSRQGGRNNPNMGKRSPQQQGQRSGGNPRGR